MSGPMMTHFLKRLGWGAMKRGLIALPVVGFILGILSAVIAFLAWQKWKHQIKKFNPWVSVSLMLSAFSRVIFRPVSRTLSVFFAKTV
jgi:cobalamin synthase